MVAMPFLFSAITITTDVSTVTKFVTDTDDSSAAVDKS